MKRKLTFCLIIALIIAILVPIAAFAASDRANFVDANNDGICDNAGQRGANFVDEDGDGVCDMRIERGCGNGNGRCGGGMQRNGCQARCK